MSRWAQYGIAFLMLLMLPVALAATLPRGAARPDYDNARVLFEPFEEETPNPFRKVLWLNGKWEFRTARDSEWNEVVVPHVWNSIPGLENYVGRAVYRLSFMAPEDWTDSVPVLCFDGVAGSVEVRVNGRKAAEQPNRNLPFEIRIEGLIDMEEENVLEVEVDNRPDTGLPRAADEKNFGGILREVYVEFRKPLQFGGMRVEAQPAAQGATASVRIATVLYMTAGGEAQVFGRIGPVDGGRGATFDMMAAADDRGRAGIEWSGEIPGADLWDQDSPTLYKASMVSITGDGMSDGVSRNFGVRKFESREKGFFLNRRGVKLNGVVWHDQFPGGWGPVANEEHIKKDIEMIKLGGFNAVRLTHPAHPALLNACDAAGLLVFEELPFSGRLPGGPDNNKRAREELDAWADGMVERDGHHPSIVAWGVGRDLDFGDERTAAAVERISARLKETGGNRSVYAGVRGFGRIRQPAGLDFIAVSDYPGWTGGSVASLRRGLNSKWIRDARKPLVLLGFGAGAVPGVTGGVGLKGTELHQLYALATAVDALDSAPVVAGRFIDGLADYEGPWLDPSGHDNTVYTGLLDASRKPKTAYQHITGISDEAPEWRWSRLRFRFPSADFVVLALLAVAGLTIWSGFSKVWPAFIEPDLLWPVEDDARNAGVGFLLFGLPMLLAAGAAASFAVSALLDMRPPDVALVAPGAIRAANLWLQPFAVRIVALTALQIAWVAASGMIVSIMLGGEPLADIELLARCCSLRMLLVVVPFLPLPPLMPVAVIFGWEIFIQAGAISRVYFITMKRALVFVLSSHAIVAFCSIVIFFYYLK